MHWLRKWSGLWLRGALFSLTAALALFLGLLDGLDRWGLDTQFTLRGPRPPRTPIIIVAVNEDSFDELNLPWPWPRAIHAQFVDTVSRAHPAVIGFDIIFDTPSSLGGEDDLALAGAIGRAGNVIMAAAMTQVVEASYIKENLNPPIKGIRDRAAGFGPVNVAIDDDAFVRRAYLGYTHQGQELSSFSLQIYRAAVRAGIPSGPIAGSSLLINYRGGPKTFPTIPYYRVLNGEVPPETFAGKIVLVGSATPVLHDLFPTPFAPQGMAGVEINANVLETLFQGISLRRIPRPVTAVLTLAASLLAVWTTNRLHAFRAFGVVLAATIAYGTASLAAFTAANLWLDTAAVPGALMLAYGGSVVENFVREQRERRRLSRFFSPAVVREIVRHKDDVNLRSTRQRVTVLFSDIRGFTTMSERMSPEEVAAFLREYFTVMTESVFQHGGTVDKYIGDAIMALYNAPFEQPDHADRAVRTALDFQKRLRPLAARFRARYGSDLRCGVGINTGEAVAGIIGSEQRLEYTAIGDTINLGSRLEGLTREFKVSIIISESTYREIEGRLPTRYLGEVTVKGKETPVRIYQVVEPDLPETGAGSA